MQPRELEVGEIVQLNPETCRNELLRGCLMIVDEPKSWGAQVYVQLPEPGGSLILFEGRAYYRATWEEMEPTGGRAEWLAP